MTSTGPRPADLPLRRARRSRLLRRATGLVLVLATTAACGGGSGTGPGGATYAALGDSESAGAGIAPTVDAGCLRSGHNYPSLVQARLHYASFTDATCSGATTKDLLRPQVTTTVVNDPQLDAVGARTRLVTLTIGLNDDQLAYRLLAACLSATGDPPALCQQVLGTSPAQLTRQLADAAARVVDSLRLIRTAAPRARIVLVGYPRFLPDTGSCPDRLPLVAAMAPLLRSALRTANDQWRAASAAAGADYLDTYALSAGHDVCSADPWINGAVAKPDEAVALHPFEAFHQAVADALVRLLGKD